MEIRKFLSFMEESEQLKSVLRTAWTSTGRRESTAEHSWRLALFAAVLSDSFPELDLSKVLIMSLIHDIGEIYDGDVSAASCPDKKIKYESEYRAVQSVFSILPEPQARRMVNVWLEYNEGTTPEAKLVKALDKAETIIQHNQGDNPPDFDYLFNLSYGREYFEGNELLQQLRSFLDERTKQKILNHNNSYPQ
ncbi:HD domain-containing protein [Eubacteriales bacterium mix99]